MKAIGERSLRTPIYDWCEFCANHIMKDVVLRLAVRIISIMQNNYGGWYGYAVHDVIESLFSPATQISGKINVILESSS